jgi:hypothetical protein
MVQTMPDAEGERMTTEKKHIYTEDPAICWDDGTPKEVCICGFKKKEHEQSIHQCVSVDNRYVGGRRTVVRSKNTAREAINWLGKNGGGVYKNALHGFELKINAQSKQESKE